MARFIASVTNDYANLDPHRSTSSVFYNFGHAIVYSRLVKPSAGPERTGDQVLITGDAAERWEQADDQTYVFRMRPGLRFQNIPPLNGRALVAQDVQYSFERQKASATSSFLPRIERLEAVDAQTLKIMLPAPDADFLAALADIHNVIIGKEAVDLKGDLSEGPTIGSSAWLIENWERDSVLRVRKSPDYYVKGVPYVDALEFVRVGENAARASAFRTQQVAVSSTGMSRADLENLKKTSPELIIVANKSRGNGLVMTVNETKPPFTDVRVRQALRMAVAVDQIRKGAFDGDGWNTTTLALPDFDWNLPDDEYTNKWFKRDVEGGRRLLAAAGVRVPIDLELVHLPLDPAWTAAAELTLAQLKDIGVNARLRVVDQQTFNAPQTQSGESDYEGFHVPPQPQTTLTADLRIRFKTGGSRNASKISDAKLDDMIEKQAAMVRDPDGRQRLVMDIQRYILDQGHTIPIWGAVQVSGRWPWLKNYRNLGQPSSEHDPFVYMWLDK
jgi:peptide/nickel transport system substrate-binding protein